MNISVSISGLESFIESEIAGIKQIVQGAMAEKFLEITRSNFGEIGIDRPKEWDALSPKYARRVKRDYATMFLSGDLESSITFESNAAFSEVATESPYCLAHQFGNPENNLPARPFFPITNESAEDTEARLTPFAEREVLAAAENIINSKIK